MAGDGELPAGRAPAQRVTLVVAEGCHLCDAARETVEEVCGADFALVVIDGHPELETRYRERIPVVEVDGQVAFTYVVHPGALAERLVTAPAEPV
ncbi:MAG: glutaredoxin family protein [Gaiella sp.]